MGSIYATDFQSSSKLAYMLQDNQGGSFWGKHFFKSQVTLSRQPFTEKVWLLYSR